MFKKICKSRAVNVVFAVFIAVLLAVPFAVLPAAAQTQTGPPTLETSKKIEPKDIWLKGLGTPDIATVTLDVEGTGETVTYRFKLDAVFAIDSSGSMSWNDGSNLRLSAAKDFVDKLDSSKDKVGVISWDSGIDWAEPAATSLSSDFTTIKAKIDTIDASGGTNLNVGLNAAKAMLDGGKRAGASQIVIFLTDGVGSYSHSTAQALADAGYVVYTIGLNISAGSTAEGYLQDIATTTGGKYFSSPTASGLQAIFEEISQTTLNTAGADVVVTEVLPGYIHFEGNAIDPDTGNPLPPTSVSPDTPGPGQTTLTWDVGTVAIGDKWEVSFDVSSSRPGTVDVDVLPDSKVTYTNYNGDPISKEFPQAQLFVKAPMRAEVNVGPAYFAGQTVEVYVMTTVGGHLVKDVTIDKITIWYQKDDDNHLSIDIPPQNVVEVTDGLHKFLYKLPDDAAGGGYKIVVESSYFGVSVAASGIFQVITIPLPWVLPIWVWALILVGVIFLLMVIAVRIAR